MTFKKTDITRSNYNCIKKIKSFAEGQICFSSHVQVLELIDA